MITEDLIMQRRKGGGSICVIDLPQKVQKGKVLLISVKSHQKRESDEMIESNMNIITPTVCVSDPRFS